MPENYTPLRCPVCGSMNLAFTEEHRSSLARIFKYLVLALMVALFLFLSPLNLMGNLKSDSTEIYTYTLMVFMIVLGIIWLVLSIVIWNTERRSHAKAICRDCGHLWLID